MRILFGLLLLLPLLVKSHSWIECTDYEDFTRPTSNNYDITKCKGWMRGWNKLYNNVQATFGTADAGCAHCRYKNGQLLSPTSMNGDSINSDTCLYSKTATGNYNAAYPSAVYTQNQKIRLIWPGKNHGGPGDGTCVSNHPDPTDKLFIKCDGGADPTLPSLVQTNTYLAVNLKQVSQNNAYGPTNSTGLGFKNCLFQCQNTDKALCYADFFLPPNVPVGTCSFYWLWELNANEWYTTCWEAQIQAAPAVTTPAPTPAPATPAPTPGAATPAPTPQAPAPSDTPAPVPSDTPATTPAPTAAPTAPARRCRRWWCQTPFIGGVVGGGTVAAGAAAGFIFYRRKKRTQGPTHIGLTNEDSKSNLNSRFL